MKRKAGIRPVERRLIARLDMNARAPLSAIAKRMRKSQQQVSYIVNSLQERGVIKGYRAIIEYARLDALHFRVYFKVSYIREKKIEQLIEYLLSDVHTSWLAVCGGTYDLICTFLVRNPSQFNKILRGIMEEYPSELQNYVVVTTVVNRHFGRKYLSDSPPHQFIFGGDRELEQADEIDLKILKILSEDARISSVELGKSVGCSPKTALERIRKLEERKLILGYTPLLDVEAAGFQEMLLLIRYHNVSVDAENKFINFLVAHPNVVRLSKTLGMWDIEISIEFEEITDFRKVEMEIRQKFAQLIQQIISIPIYTTFKDNSFPGYLTL